VVLAASDGSAINGATVIALDPRIGKAFEATTNEEGEFEIADLDPDVSYYLSAVAKGMAPQGRPSTAPGDDVVMELEDAASISGVVMKDDKPAQGVKVDLDE